jgi:hypothetical protein
MVHISYYADPLFELLLCCSMVGLRYLLIEYKVVRNVADRMTMVNISYYADPLFELLLCCSMVGLSKDS